MTIEGMIFFGVLLIVMGLITIVSLSISKDNTLLHNDSNNLKDEVSLRERLDVLLVSVRDLDMDYDMRKITPEVYAEQRKMLLGRAVGVLHRLDIAQQTSNEDVNLEVEAAILAFRRDT